MALSQGRGTETSNSYKLYSGIDRFKVLGVNPDLETLKSWGVNLKNEPSYTRTDDDGTKCADIVVWVKSVKFPDLVTHVDFTVRNKKNEANIDGVHKTEMIDCFGNTAWLSDDEVRNKIVPLLKSGKPSPFYPQNMRPSRRGERALTEFFKFFVNVVDSHDYKDGSWVLRSNAENDANYRFEEINKYFLGDVTELRGEIEKWPEDTVKLLCGVYSDKSGRMRQTVYPDLCFRAAAATAKIGPKFSKEISSRKAKGRLSNHDYIFDEIQEWGVTPSSKEEPNE